MQPDVVQRSYEIVSIQRAEAPPGAECANWYRYVIARGGTNTVHGCRQGSLKDVTSVVEDIVMQLNLRHGKKSDRPKKT